jgi:hypothetical protein
MVQTPLTAGVVCVLHRQVMENKKSKELVDNYFGRWDLPARLLFASEEEINRALREERFSFIARKFLIACEAELISWLAPRRLCVPRWPWLPPKEKTSQDREPIDWWVSWTRQPWSTRLCPVVGLHDLMPPPKPMHGRPSPLCKVVPSHGLRDRRYSSSIYAWASWPKVLSFVPRFHFQIDPT